MADSTSTADWVAALIIVLSAVVIHRSLLKARRAEEQARRLQYGEHGGLIVKFCAEEDVRPPEDMGEAERLLWHFDRQREVAPWQ